MDTHLHQIRRAIRAMSSRFLIPFVSSPGTLGAKLSNTSTERMRAVSLAVDTESVKPHLERAVFGFGLVNPLLALPQLYNIFAFRHVGGLSAITLGATLVMSVLWTAYGLLGRQTALWATSAVWVVLNGAMLTGVAVFR